MNGNEYQDRRVENREFFNRVGRDVAALKIKLADLEKDVAGLMETRRDADKLLRYVLCPTWHLVARIGIAMLAVIGVATGSQWISAFVRSLGMG